MSWADRPYVKTFRRVSFIAYLISSSYRIMVSSMWPIINRGIIPNKSIHIQQHHQMRWSNIPRVQDSDSRWINLSSYGDMMDGKIIVNVESECCHTTISNRHCPLYVIAALNHFKRNVALPWLPSVFFAKNKLRMSSNRAFGEEITRTMSGMRCRVSAPLSLFQST